MQQVSMQLETGVTEAVLAWKASKLSPMVSPVLSEVTKMLEALQTLPWLQ